MLAPDVCVTARFAASMVSLTAKLEDAPFGSPTLLVITSDNVPFFIRAARAARGKAVVVLEPTIDAPGGLLTDVAIERLAGAVAASRGNRWWVLFVEAEKLARPSTILSANALMRLAETHSSLKTKSGDIVRLDAAAILVVHRGVINGAEGMAPLDRLREGWAKVYEERGGLAAESNRRAMNMDALFGRIGGLVDATQSGTNKQWLAAAGSLDCKVARAVSTFQTVPQGVPALTAAIFFALLLFFVYPRQRTRRAPFALSKTVVPRVSSLPVPATAVAAASPASAAALALPAAAPAAAPTTMSGTKHKVKDAPAPLRAKSTPGGARKRRKRQ